FSVTTRALTGDGKVEKLAGAEVEWIQDEGGNWRMQAVEGSDFNLQADLVLLAMGFIHPTHNGMISDLGVETDARGNVKIDDKYQTSKENIFAAGDMAHGQSLIVRAIASGRKMAKAIDIKIKGHSHLA
ncbi:MAG: glutamate synthase (NADPH/NADH) small chain, partial [bacterium]